MGNVLVPGVLPILEAVGYYNAYKCGDKDVSYKGRDDLWRKKLPYSWWYSPIQQKRYSILHGEGRRRLLPCRLGRHLEKEAWRGRIGGRDQRVLLPAAPADVILRFV